GLRGSHAFAASEGTPRSKLPAQRSGRRLRVRLRFCGAIFRGSKSRALPQMAPPVLAKEHRESGRSCFGGQKTPNVEPRSAKPATQCKEERPTSNAELRKLSELSIGR